MKNFAIKRICQSLMICSLLLFFGNSAHAASTIDFVTTWTTTAPNESITIPTTGAGYNYNVDWGDTNADTGLTGDATHTYASAGTYTVSISGDFPRIFFDFAGDRLKIQSVEQWGDQDWTSFERAFAGAENLVINAVDEPDLSNVTSLSGMFNNADAMNDDISNWDTSNITDMSEMFRDADIFNRDIEAWNTSSVQDMSFMFFQTGAFSQPLGDWDTSNVLFMNSMFATSVYASFIDGWVTSSVQDMSFMFSQATNFDDNISSWDTSSVQDMEAMFQGANSFDQPIGTWDTSSVTNMSGMFRNNNAFNQSINDWDTSLVQDMSEMFRNMNLYDQDISAWNIESLTDATSMLDGTPISRYYYDQILNSWASQNVQQNVVFGGGPNTYCVQSSRDTLTNAPNSWTITDGGLNTNCANTTGAFVTAWKTINSNENVTIQTNPSFTYDFNIDWGDGFTDSNVTGDITHNYTLSGAYEVVITGDFPSLYLNGSVSDGSEDKIISIDQWGDQVWESLDSSFEGASNLGYRATDAPDLSSATSLNQTFAQATIFNGDISNWDTSNITSMANMFQGAESFDQPIGSWNTSNVLLMFNMFNVATAFNQDISNWNTSSVVNMGSMFQRAENFNQPIGSWNVSNVENISLMFERATNFNQPLNSWNTSSVNSMISVFLNATNFNQPLNSWNTSGVTSMQNMFADSAFDQNIGSWDVTSLTDASSMFNDAPLSRANYDALLSRWSTQSLNSGVSLGTSAKYCDEDARAILTNPPNNWVITDEGLDTNCPVTTSSSGSSSGSGNNSSPFGSGGGSSSSNNSQTPLEIVNERLTNLPISQCLELDPNSPISFTDNQNPPSYVETLSQLKLDGSLKGYIVEGNANGQLNLFSDINRAEVVITLLSSHCLPILDVNTLPNTTYLGNPMPEFSDLPRNGTGSETQWLRDTLYTAAYYEVVKGNDDGTVQAGRSVNSAELFTILSRLSALTEENSETPTQLNSLEDIWYKDSVEDLLSEGVLELSLFENYDFGADITRDFVFEILVNAIDSRNLQM